MYITEDLHLYSNYIAHIGFLRIAISQVIKPGPGLTKVRREYVES